MCYLRLVILCEYGNYFVSACVMCDMRLSAILPVRICERRKSDEELWKGSLCKANNNNKQINETNKTNVK